jgi:hypothetical protein
VNPSVAKVHTMWERLDILNPHTATQAQIDSFEQRFDVILPRIFRDYFTSLNGTIGGCSGWTTEI